MKKDTIIIELPEDLSTRLQEAIAKRYHYPEQVLDPDWTPPTEKELEKNPDANTKRPMVDNPVDKLEFVKSCIVKEFLKRILVTYENNLAREKVETNTGKQFEGLV